MEREPEAAEAGHCTAGRAACTGPRRRRCTAEDTTAAVAAVAAWAFVVVLVFVVVVGLVFVELESISKILVLSLVM